MRRTRDRFLRAHRPDDAVLLLIDHRSGLFQVETDQPYQDVRANVGQLAKLAKLADIPVITTASVPDGPNGSLIPEIHEIVPDAQYVPRDGEVNAWDVEAFREAVRATGRKTIIMAAIITAVCLVEPAINARADGYQVFGVIDASGTYSKLSQEVTVARLTQAGVVPVDTVSRCPRSRRPGIDRRARVRRAVRHRDAALPAGTAGRRRGGNTHRASDVFQFVQI